MYERACIYMYLRSWYYPKPRSNEGSLRLISMTSEPEVRGPMTVVDILGYEYFFYIVKTTIAIVPEPNINYTVI